MRKQPPTRTFRPPALAVDPEKYPGLESNPSLERALRIRQALDKGKPREEAVALAEQAMGSRAPAMMRSRPSSAAAAKGAARKPAKARPGREAAKAAKAAKAGKR